MRHKGIGTMSVALLGARLSAVDDDSGARIAQRREDLGMSVKSLAERAGIDRGVLTRIEKGQGARTTSVRLVERALDELEHEMGIDVPSVVAQPVGDPEGGLVEFTVEGHFGVKAVVKGPIRDIDKLQEAVGRLIAGMDRPHPEG